ncbi:hypothetical protein [Paenibacillus sp. SI8]|uniref:hypothetical protein n=1 Tax=unclassified Paenibacillus TaxID=185978 RepID=UPI00346593F2
MSMLVDDFPWWPMTDWSGTTPEEITRRTGVKLNITISSDERELPFRIASNNLPELVFTDKELSRLSTNKMSYDWNSLIAQYAPDFTIDKRKIALHTQANGKFYNEGGFGIYNVHERIKAYYGTGSGLYLESREGYGTTCTMKLKKQERQAS